MRGLCRDHGPSTRKDTAKCSRLNFECSVRSHSCLYLCFLSSSFLHPSRSSCSSYSTATVPFTCCKYIIRATCNSRALRVRRVAIQPLKNAMMTSVQMWKDFFFDTSIASGSRGIVLDNGERVGLQFFMKDSTVFSESSSTGKILSLYNYERVIVYIFEFNMSVCLRLTCLQSIVLTWKPSSIQHSCNQC